MIRPFSVILLAIGLLAQPTAAQGTASDVKVLVLGDSFLEWHRTKGNAIPQVLARRTGWQVTNRAASGAKMYLTGAEGNARGVIPAQFRPGDWDWIIINGGANDLLTKCGCRRCDAVLDRIITKDGRGGILPDLVARSRSTGAKVALVGYIGNPRANLFSRCRDEVQDMATRQQRLAARDGAVIFFSSRRVVDLTKRSSFALDGFHPSQRSTRRIGANLAAVLQRGIGQ